MMQSDAAYGLCEVCLNNYRLVLCTIYLARVFAVDEISQYNRPTT